MDRMKRIAGLARGASTVLARTKDEDESLVLFGELYRNDQEKDVNLLEPMYSVEFEAIHGDSRMFKLPSGKRDYLLPDGEKHNYDWLKTPPATPLFRSLEMEADSSQMVFQKELPLLQPVTPSRFSKKTEAVSMSTLSESPTTSSSSKSATPTARPSSSSKKNLTTTTTTTTITTTTRGSSPAVSEHENSAYRIDKRSSYTPLANRQQSAVPAARKTSGKKQPTVPGSTNAAKNIAAAKPPPTKNIASATTPRDRSKGPVVGAKDLKVDGGNSGATRRASRPPAATTGTGNGELNAVAARGRGRAGGKPVAGNGAARVAAEAVVKGRRRGVGEKEQMQMQRKLGSHAKKLVG